LVDVAVAPQQINEIEQRKNHR